MQPYLFPYIGYFQMINYVDYFIIDDNVQYINRGWINRNRILLDGKDYMITLPVVKASSHLNINERYFVDDPDKKNEKKLMKTIYHAYRNAPEFKVCYELLEEIFNFSNKNVAEFTGNSLKQICNYLGIEVTIIMQSTINSAADLNYQDSIIQTCKKLKADSYINAIGGMELYSAKRFRKNNLSLKFIKTKDSIEYKQFKNTFLPNLSIIDVMMFNSKTDIVKLLCQYDLVDGKN